MTGVLTCALPISSGNSDGAFRIDSANGNLYVNNPSKFDYETKTENTLTVKVTDGKLSDSANIKIQIQDVPETDGQYAIKFDGNDDWIQLPKPLNIGSSSNTIEMWLKIPKVGEGLNSGERVGILLGNYSSSPN